MATMYQSYDGVGRIWNEDVLVAETFTATSSVKVRGTMMVAGDINVKGDLEVEKLLCAGRVKTTGKLKATRSGYYKSLSTDLGPDYSDPEVYKDLVDGLGGFTD